MVFSDVIIIENLPKLGAVEVAPKAGVDPNAGAAEVAAAPNAEVEAPNEVFPNDGATDATGAPNSPVEGWEVAPRPNPGVAGLEKVNMSFQCYQ